MRLKIRIKNVFGLTYERRSYSQLIEIVNKNMGGAECCWIIMFFYFSLIPTVLNRCFIRSKFFICWCLLKNKWGKISADLNEREHLKKEIKNLRRDMQGIMNSAITPLFLSSYHRHLEIPFLWLVYYSSNSIFLSSLIT